MSRHVEPNVLELIRYEGFWATERPHWSLSRTPSDGYLQVGRMCLFPAAIHNGEIVLTTCTNGRDITWDIALDRGYTLMPKPFTARRPVPVRPPGWPALVARGWRSRYQHRGLLLALRYERAEAIQATERQNTERQAAHQAAADEWGAQRNAAHDAFRERHS
jgi:hypothetical protein